MRVATYVYRGTNGRITRPLLDIFWRRGGASVHVWRNPQLWSVGVWPRDICLGPIEVTWSRWGL